MEYRLSNLAFDDLAEIHAYIARDSHDAAQRFIGRLYDKFEFLGTYPELVSDVPNLPAATCGSSPRGTMSSITEFIRATWKSHASCMALGVRSTCSAMVIDPVLPYI
jgi:plasmid stabilization system protein ParE